MKPIFSALGLVAAGNFILITGSLMYLVKTFIEDSQNIIEK